MSVTTIWTIPLMIHLLFGTALLGAITHQALAVTKPLRRVTTGNFVTRFRAVAPTTYTNAIVFLYVNQVLLGAELYLRYFASIRASMEQSNAWKTLGAFEWKVNAATIGLILLPAYWYFWTQTRSSQFANTRKWLTALLGAIVWCAFLIGHLAVNVRGFGS